MKALSASSRGRILFVFAILLSFVWTFHSTPSFAAADKTICQGEAARTSGLSDFIFVRESFKTGKKPLIIELSSIVLNKLKFNGATVSWEPIVAPQAGYTFQKFIVTVDPSQDCALSGDIFARFSTGNGTVDIKVGDESIQASRETVFNSIMDVLGFPDVTLPTGSDAEVAVEVCERIQSELTDGNGLGLSTAGDIGSLAGSLQANMGRCLWNSSLVDVVDTNGVKTSACSPDDFAAKLTLDFLRGAPEINLHVTSSGTGTYEVTNLDNTTHATVTLNSDGTCSAFSDFAF